MQHKVFEPGHVVGGQFHNKGRNFAAHRGGTHNYNRHYCGDYAQKIHRVGYQIYVRKAHHIAYAARNRREYGQLCAAAEKGNYPYGCRALLFVCQRAGVNHCGERAAEAHYHRHKRPARKAEAAENSVQNERHARHIARIFENGEEQKQREYLRQEAQNGRNAAHYAVVYQASSPFSGARGLNAQAYAVYDVVEHQI